MALWLTLPLDRLLAGNGRGPLLGPGMARGVYLGDGFGRGGARFSFVPSDRRTRLRFRIQLIDDRTFRPLLGMSVFGGALFDRYSPRIGAAEVLVPHAFPFARPRGENTLNPSESLRPSNANQCHQHIS